VTEQDQWVRDLGQEEVGEWGVVGAEGVWAAIVPERDQAAIAFAPPAEPKLHIKWGFPAMM
jgi:hypothetical protein